MSECFLYVDCFDDYTAPAQRWPVINVSTDWVMSTSIVRTGSQSLHSLGNTSAAAIGQSFAARSTGLMGFAIYTPYPGGEFAFALFHDGSANNPQVCLTCDAGGTMRARRGVASGTLLGTCSAILPSNAWHYVEFKVKVDGSTGTVDVWLDGVNVLSLTGQNTSFTGSNTFNSMRLQEIGSSYYDDLYMLDPTVGGAYSGPLGDVKMLLGMPIGNGSTNNYTNVFASWAAATAMVVGQTIKDSNGNVQRVQSISGTGTTGGAHPTWATNGGTTTTDNAGANQVVWVCVGTGANPGAANWMATSETPPDDNSSYVTDATPGDIDRYVFPAIAGSTVKAVCVNIRAEKDDAGTRTIRAVTKSGATLADSGTDLALALNSYSNYQGFFDTDPNTGVAWTVSGVNAAEFGVKTTA